MTIKYQLILLKNFGLWSLKLINIEKLMFILQLYCINYFIIFLQGNIRF